MGAVLHCSSWASHCGGFSGGAQALECMGLVAVVCRLSCSVACGVFPDQGLNPCLLHWQADSLPLSHQGSPTISFNSFSTQKSKTSLLTMQTSSCPSFLLCLYSLTSLCWMSINLICWPQISCMKWTIYSCLLISTSHIGFLSITQTCCTYFGLRHLLVFLCRMFPLKGLFLLTLLNCSRTQLTCHI